MIKEKLEAPKEIYLQYVDYLEDSWDEFDFTWCEDRIDESDVRYIRFDIVDDLLTALNEVANNLYCFCEFARACDSCRAKEKAVAAAAKLNQV